MIMGENKWIFGKQVSKRMKKHAFLPKNHKKCEKYTPLLLFRISKCFKYNLTISTLVGELFTKSEFMRGWSTYPSLHSTPGYWSTPRGATLLLLDIDTFIHQDTQIHSTPGYRYFYTLGYTDTLLLLDIDTFIH